MACMFSFASASTSASEDGEVMQHVDEDAVSVDGDCLPPASPSSYDNGGRRTGWRAVWCWERCNKSEEAPVRAAMVKTVADLGGTLTCFKKARTFELRALRMRKQRYALITDGREARPCVEALTTRPEIHPPALMVVLSKEPKHAARLRPWARQLPKAGFKVPVFVIQDVAELGPLLSASDLDVQSNPELPRLASTPNILHEDEVRECAEPVPEPPASPIADATRTPPVQWAAVAITGACLFQPQWPVPGVGQAPASKATFLIEKGAEGIDPATLRVLAALVPATVHAESLAQVLAQCAPDVYED